MKGKKTVLILSLVFLAYSALAQRPEATRKSLPDQISKQIGDATITIDYSRPAKKGRKIFGGIEAYGKVWRTGANETTWIEVDRDVEIEGQPLEAGKYGLFTIPGEDEWIIIFNEKWDGWGAYEYNVSDDVLRVKVVPQVLEVPVELLTISISEQGKVSIAWDRTQVHFSIK